MRQNLGYIITLLSLLAVPAWAQQQTCVNHILLNKHVLCVNDTIKAEHCNYNIDTLAADYNYGESLTDTVTQAQSPQHVYTKAGIYKIRQAVPNQDQTSRIVFVLPKASPLIELSYCEGKTIALLITDSSYTIYSLDSTQSETYSYDRYIIDFGDGSPPRTVSGGNQTQVHTYTAPGNSFEITIRGVFDAANCGGDTTLSVDFNNKAFAAPITQTLTVLEQSANGKVELMYSGHNYLFYKLEQRTNNGAYQPIDTLNPQAPEATWQNTSTINTASSAYCYRLTAINYCDESRNLPSDDICSTILNATVDATAGTINLSWPRYPLNAPGLSYQLFRDNVALGNAIPANGPTTYIDSAVACGRTYSYRLEISYQGQQGPLRSISATQTLRAESTRPLKDIEGFYSSIENNRVVVRWSYPADIILKNFQLYRDGIPAASLQDTIYIDESVNPATTTYCYTLSYEDSCGNRSALSQASCPVRLTAETTGRYQNELHWTPYRDWMNGVAGYTIEYLDADGFVYKSIPVFMQTTYSDNQISPEQQVIRYRIKAEPTDPQLPPSYSNIVEIKQRARLVFPNAFNPLGHPENRIFKPQWRYVSAYDLQVFNRWGEMVFQSFDINEGWNGLHRGKPAAEDMYVYRVLATDETGERFEMTGTVMLLYKQ